MLFGQWPELLGCPSKPQSSVHPPLTFTVGNAPFTVESVEGPTASHTAPALCFAVLTPIFATDWSFSTSCCTASPLQSKEQAGTFFFTGEEFPSPPAAVEGAGRS